MGLERDAACHPIVLTPEGAECYCSNMDAEHLLARIRTEDATVAGKPTIRTTRVAVEHVLAMLADGADADSLLHDYPFLEPDDIRACLLYAWSIVAREEISLVAR